jgi:lysozyme
MILIALILFLLFYLSSKNMITQDALNFIIREEGFRDANNKLRFDPRPGDLFSPYDDGFGNWTTGIGHLIKSSESKLRLKKLNFDEAMNLYKIDINDAKIAVERNVKVPLLIHEKESLMSLAFNLGETKFKTTELLKYINTVPRAAWEPSRIQYLFEQWRSGGALLSRRTREGKLFNSAKYV